MRKPGHSEIRGSLICPKIWGQKIWGQTGRFPARRIHQRRVAAPIEAQQMSVHTGSLPQLKFHAWVPQPVAGFATGAGSPPVNQPQNRASEKRSKFKAPFAPFLHF